MIATLAKCLAYFGFGFALVIGIADRAEASGREKPRDGHDIYVAYVVAETGERTCPVVIDIDYTKSAEPNVYHRDVLADCRALSGAVLANAKKRIAHNETK